MAQLKDSIFLGYLVFAKETAKSREEFEQRVLKAVDDYLLAKEIEDGTLTNGAGL